MRTKVTDGDFLIVSYPRDLPKESIDNLRDSITKWIGLKDLKNVCAMLNASNSATIEFRVLSVNDAFEEQVLK